MRMTMLQKLTAVAMLRPAETAWAFADPKRGGLPDEPFADPKRVGPT